MAANGQERWERETYRPAVARLPERRNPFETESGVPVGPLYSAQDDADDEALGFPGEFPFTRGIQPTMYRSRLCER